MAGQTIFLAGNVMDITGVPKKSLFLFFLQQTNHTLLSVVD
jgi:hypothetical protein